MSSVLEYQHCEANFGGKRCDIICFMVLISLVGARVVCLLTCTHCGVHGSGIAAGRFVVLCGCVGALRCDFPCKKMVQFCNCNLKRKGRVTVAQFACHNGFSTDVLSSAERCWYVYARTARVQQNFVVWRRYQETATVKISECEHS